MELSRSLCAGQNSLLHEDPYPALGDKVIPWLSRAMTGITVTGHEGKRDSIIILDNTPHCVSQAGASAGPDGFFPWTGSGVAVTGPGQEEIRADMGIHPLSSAWPYPPEACG